MKSTLAILCAAGATAAATAGSSVTYHFDLNGDALSGENVVAGIGDTLTWTVWASFSGYDDPTAYFGGFVGDFIASNSAAGTASNIQVLMSGNAVTPTIDGATINGINMFNSALLGTDDPANPLMVMTFDTTVDSADGWSYTTDGVSSVFANDGIFQLPDEFTSAAVISDTVVIPAPGAVALLGLGGLTAIRRRR